MKQYLLKSRKAEAAIESVILMPLMSVTLMLLLYLFLIAISNVIYTNYSNTLAADLNQRQSAVQDIKILCNGDLGRCPQIRSINPGGNLDALSGMHHGATTMEDSNLFRFMSQVSNVDRDIYDVDLYVNGIHVTDTSSNTYKVISYLYYARLIKGGGLFPASYIEKIEVEFNKNGTLWNPIDEPYSTLTSGKLSGTQITTKITYRCLGFPFTSKGFNIIT